MRIIENRKLEEDFTELSEFNDLNKHVEEIVKMYKNWYKHSLNISREEWREYGYPSFSAAEKTCKEEIIDFITKKIIRA